MDNVEIIRLFTDYCCCIKIGNDIGPPAVLHPIPILVKITISMADILADPIIGTPLVPSGKVSASYADNFGS